MKLSEIKATLADRGILLTKSLGQNFLHDQNQIRRIVDAADLREGEQILEIGPGLGPLTGALLERQVRLTSIEIDRRLVEFLGDRFQSEPLLTLLHADALEWLRTTARDWSDWKLVANLPYSVGSPTLIELALMAHPPRRMTATLQAEVVDRILASCNTRAYGIMTLLILVSYEPMGRFKIPATCFFPEPDVESSCVTLERRAKPLLDEGQRATYVKLVKLAFSQRRKIVWKLLKQRWKPELLEAIRIDLDLDPMVRAQALSLEQFVALARRLH
jgi:16S rRNA (adenine1518-N6/adenine1519-N6)-dimethyltransferase